jgi:hypothetical protein
MDQIDAPSTFEVEEPPMSGTAAFLSGLADAMREAATRERDRIARDVAEDAHLHAEKARARALVEADALRASAAEDIAAIEAWRASEVLRIRDESAARTAQRQVDLATYLDRHAAIIDAEIAGIDAAVVDYGAALDSFVASLIQGAGAAEIARQAESLPTPPSLDAVRANARSAAVAAFEDADGGDETPQPSTTAAGVGVMDPDAPGRPSEPPLPVDPLRPTEADADPTQEPVSHGNGTVRILRIFAPRD